MIVLKITNASEVMASNIGKFLERLTPDSFDNHKIEDIVIERLVQSLMSEGIRGEVASIDGVDLHEKELLIHNKLKVRNCKQF
jgi:hypothetical protein